MAILKAKNTSGEWVNIANAEATTITNELVGDIKVITVKAKDQYTYDLSEYVGSNSNFLFFFKSTTNSSVSAAGGELFVLDKTEGTARKAKWNTNVADMGWFNHPSSMSNASTLFPDGWQFEGTWDNDACILTFPETGASDYGILFYATAEEA